MTQHKPLQSDHRDAERAAHQNKELLRCLKGCRTLEQEQSIKKKNSFFFSFPIPEPSEKVTKPLQTSVTRTQWATVGFLCSQQGPVPRGWEHSHPGCRARKARQVCGMSLSLTGSATPARCSRPKLPLMSQLLSQRVFRLPCTSQSPPSFLDGRQAQSSAVWQRCSRGAKAPKRNRTIGTVQLPSSHFLPICPGLCSPGTPLPLSQGMLRSWAVREEQLLLSGESPEYQGDAACRDVPQY